MSQLNRLKKTIGKVIDLKQDKPVYLAGLLGTYKDGVQQVKVPGRSGYVYVRIGGNQSELVEAVNGAVREIFDLKVLITIPDTNPDIYLVVGRDYSQYTSAPPTVSLVKHGETHSFTGNDPTFIYKKQLVQPLQPRPTVPESDHLYVEADFYLWKNEIKYFPGANTANLTVANPTLGTVARFLTVYLDGDSNTLGYLTGTEFSTFPFAPTGTIYLMPTVSPTEGLLLASVLLQTGTSTYDWDSYYDLRNFLDGGGSTALLHPLDPADGYHTGSLPATSVSITDVHNHYTGTNVETALDELWHKTPNLHGLDPIDGYHTGTIRSSISTIVDTGGYYTSNNVEDALQEIGIDIENLEAGGGGDGGGGGHAHSVTRLNLVSGTQNVSLFDFLEYIEFVSYNGFIIDPIYYSLSSGSSHLVLDNPVSTDGIVTINGVILQV